MRFFKFGLRELPLWDAIDYRIWPQVEDFRRIVLQIPEDLEGRLYRRWLTADIPIAWMELTESTVRDLLERPVSLDRFQAALLAYRQLRLLKDHGACNSLNLLLAATTLRLARRMEFLGGDGRHFFLNVTFMLNAEKRGLALSQVVDWDRLQL